jgi:hypothetical protein
MSFLWETAGPMELPVTVGPGKTLSMACKSVREIVRRAVGSVVWTSAMKSST